MKNKIISKALAMVLVGTLLLLTPATSSTVFAEENNTTESVVSSNEDSDEDNNMQIFLPLVIVLIAGLVLSIGDDN